MTQAVTEPPPAAGAENKPLRPFDKFLDWIGEHPTVVISLSGAVAYIGLRLAFVSFYHQFGLTPEDVGYDYGTVLTTTLPGMGLLLVALMLPLGIVAFSMSRSPATRTRGTLRNRVLWLLFALLPLYVIVLLIVLSGSRMSAAAHRAAAGHTIDGESLASVPVFPWTVRPATVTPITKDARAYAGDLAELCVMYLGTSSSNHILWDIKDKTVLRVPLAAAQVKTGKFPSDDCKPAD
jgi:hypothetical protein